VALLKKKFDDLSGVGGNFAGTIPKLIIAPRHGTSFGDDLLFTNNHPRAKYTSRSKVRRRSEILRKKNEEEIDL